MKKQAMSKQEITRGVEFPKRHLMKLTWWLNYGTSKKILLDEMTIPIKEFERIYKQIALITGMTAMEYNIMKGEATVSGKEISLDDLQNAKNVLRAARQGVKDKTITGQIE